MTKLASFVITLWAAYLFSISAEMVLASDLDLYAAAPMKHEILDGTRLPLNSRHLEKLTIRAARGEYEPASFLIDPHKNINNIQLEWTDLQGPGTMPADSMDVCVVKVWWVAHTQMRMGSSKFKKEPWRIRKPVLVQELLLHDDGLVRVNRSRILNEVRVKSRLTGKEWYVDVSSDNASFPANVFVYDTPKITPFNLEKGLKKQIWITVHVPENAVPGLYSGKLNIIYNKTIINSIPIALQVLPFSLDPPNLHYGLYYRGRFDGPLDPPPGRSNKSREQYCRELHDMKNHGYPYPGCQMRLRNMAEVVEVLKKEGLPTDRFIFQRDDFIYKDTSPLTIGREVNRWVGVLKKHNPKSDLFFYGKDEASGAAITDQLPSWREIRANGGKTWASISVGQFELTEGQLDVAVLHGGTQAEGDSESGFDGAHKKEIEKYHKIGAKVWSYAHPFAGQENAEIYRRNYGLALWMTGYDGVMNWVYQMNEADKLFSDFLPSNYRDCSFTIPITNGLISTIGWEGCREGVDDVRYLATLLNSVKRAGKNGKNVAAIESWIKSIDAYKGNLDGIRYGIVDRILQLNNN